MSAYICSDDHIHVLVNYAVNQRASYFWNPRRIEITLENANKIGQVLLDENYRSVNYRYGENVIAHDYKFKRPTGHYKPVDILKAISCLDYQSCETNDWSESQAWAILDGLKDYAIRNLPGYETSNGWNL